MGRRKQSRKVLSTTVLMDVKGEHTEANPKYASVISSAEIAPSPRYPYRVVLTRNEDGWMTAQCVEVPGAISQGKDVFDALKNILEALTGVLEATHPEQASNIVISWQENKITT